MHMFLHAKGYFTQKAIPNILGNQPTIGKTKMFQATDMFRIHGPLRVCHHQSCGTKRMNQHLFGNAIEQKLPLVATMPGFWEAFPALSLLACSCLNSQSGKILGQNDVASVVRR